MHPWSGIKCPLFTRALAPALLLSLGAGDALATCLKPAEARVEALERTDGPVEAVTGSVDVGQCTARLSAGFPWQQLELQYGLKERLTVVGGLQSALFVRNTAYLGVHMDWLPPSRFTLGGDALLSYLGQSGELAQRGPGAILRMRAAYQGHHLTPYLHLTLQDTLLLDRTVIEYADGTDSSLDVTPSLAKFATLGLHLKLSRRLGLEAGLDLFDPPGDAFALPGLHVGLTTGEEGR